MPVMRIRSQFDQLDHVARRFAEEGGKASQANAILARAGLSGTGAAGLVDAMARPDFGGTLAALAYRAGEVVVARNLAVVQGQSGADSVIPSAADPEIFEIASADEPTLRSLLIDWLAGPFVRPN